MVGRRDFLIGLGAAGIALAAPAIIRTPGLLMPIKSLIVPSAEDRWFLRYELDGGWHEKPLTYWHQDVDTLESAAPAGAKRIAIHFQRANKTLNMMYG